jgi:hypothetical protein
LFSIAYTEERGGEGYQEGVRRKAGGGERERRRREGRKSGKMKEGRGKRRS